MNLAMCLAASSPGLPHLQILIACVYKNHWRRPQSQVFAASFTCPISLLSVDALHILLGNIQYVIISALYSVLVLILRSRIEEEQLTIPSIQELRRYQIVVATLSTARALALMGLPKGHFTHIFIDEAAQVGHPSSTCLILLFSLLPSLLPLPSLISTVNSEGWIHAMHIYIFKVQMQNAKKDGTFIDSVP